MRKKRIKKNRVFILVLFIIILFLSIYFISNIDRTSAYNLKIKEILDSNREEIAELDKVRIYGTHLNIDGNLDKKVYLDNIDSAKIIFKSLYENDKDMEIETEYNVNSKGQLIFYTSDKINDGIDLESLKTGDYILVLELKEKNYNTDSYDTNYYKIINKDDTKKFEYYTITKNNKNNKIVLNNYENTIKEKNYEYTKIEIKDVKLPDNVYDITIDPGHGGLDGGAVRGNYNEKDLTLEYGILLKEELEKLGLKVKLTRDGTNEEELDIYDMYGENGRAVIPNNVKSKFALSIHLNSAEYFVGDGGIEIYIPNNINMDFSTKLAENIVESADTTYSENSSFKVEDGIYLRNFTYSDIEQSNIDAKKNGYEPYNLNTDTPYYFFIRETGGLNTNAYVDGRNTNYGKNKYYNSSIGVESYLLELGYMVSDIDFNNLVENKKGYVDGIVKTFKEYLENYK